MPDTHTKCELVSIDRFLIQKQENRFYLFFNGWG